jgi:acetolactate synthase-1/2/3 large subunit
MFNVQELATIASYKLPIKIILLNNGGYASIRSTQGNFFKGNYVGTGPEDKIQYPNYKKLCSSFNIKYIKIAKISDFSKIKKNLFSNKPVFFDIVLRNNELLIPKIKTIIDKNNNFISMPLEDLSPLLKIKDLKKEIFFPVKYISKFARNLN